MNFNQHVLKEIDILHSASAQCYDSLLDNIYECALVKEKIQTNVLLLQSFRLLSNHRIVTRGHKRLSY